MLARVQQIQQLGSDNENKHVEAKTKKSAGLFGEKLQEKVTSRVAHMDCEDILDLLRYLSKVSLPQTSGTFKQQKVQWVQEVMIEISKRMEAPEFLHEMRLLYSVDNWIAFMINCNLTFQNIIIASGCPLIKGIKEANVKLGSLLSEEVKKNLLAHSSSQIKSKDMLTIYDQLSRFHQSNMSVLKEVHSKLIGQISKPEHFVHILHVSSRFEDQENKQYQSTLGKLANAANQGISQLTYEQIGSYLESLVLNGFKPSGEFSLIITKELEERQKAISSSEGQKLQIQDCVKIFRSLMHLGCNHEISQSMILLRAFSNILNKNKDKMTTSQVTDCMLFLRQAMLYPVGQNVHSRLLNVYNQMREQFEQKIFKIAPGRLLLVLLQNKFIKDQHSLLKCSKEVKSNMVKALIQNVDSIHHKQEIRLISSIFSGQSFESSKFIGFALQQIFYGVKGIKEALLKKKGLNEELAKQLETIHKLVYLMCIHEAAEALAEMQQPLIIQGREHWNELQGHISTLKSVGAYNNYASDSFTEDIALFQKLILEDKFCIVDRKEERKEPEKFALARSEKLRSAIGDSAKAEVSQRIQIQESVQIPVDLFLPEQKRAFKMVESTKIPTDVRFVERKTILEQNKLFFEGESSYTLSRQVLQAYEGNQLCPLQAYYLKFFEGITLSLADHRRIKDQDYVENLIRL